MDRGSGRHKLTMGITSENLSHRWMVRLSVRGPATVHVNPADLAIGA